MHKHKCTNTNAHTYTRAPCKQISAYLNLYAQVSFYQTKGSHIHVSAWHCSYWYADSVAGFWCGMAWPSSQSAAIVSDTEAQQQVQISAPANCKCIASMCIYVCVYVLPHTKLQYYITRRTDIGGHPICGMQHATCHHRRCNHDGCCCQRGVLWQHL